MMFFASRCLALTFRMKGSGALLSVNGWKRFLTLKREFQTLRYASEAGELSLGPSREASQRIFFKGFPRWLQRNADTALGVQTGSLGELLEALNLEH